MATAKKAAPKAAVSKTKPAAPAKVSTPVAKTPAKKAPVSKTVQAIARITANLAKLTERKDKLAAEIKTLRDQRAALKAAPAPVPAPAAASPAAKAAAPAKAAKPAAKKTAKKK